MGSVHNSIPMWLGEKLQREFGLTAFVETGLAQGTSVLWAESIFQYVISIEISAALVTQFKERYPHSKAVLFEGDSGRLLRHVINEIEVPALFWLDGHTDDDCPVLKELSAINASLLDHIILIDDARLFGDLAAWPTRETVIEAAQDNGRRSIFLIDDVIVAVPRKFMVRTGEIISRR